MVAGGGRADINILLRRRLCERAQQGKRAADDLLLCCTRTVRSGASQSARSSAGWFSRRSYTAGRASTTVVASIGTVQMPDRTLETSMVETCQTYLSDAVRVWVLASVTKESEIVTRAHPTTPHLVGLNQIWDSSDPMKQASRVWAVCRQGSGGSEPQIRQ